MIRNEQSQQSSPAYKPSDLLDEREAALYLKLSATTLRNWRAAKKGPAALKIGSRAIRYRCADLEDFITTSTKGVA